MGVFTELVKILSENAFLLENRIKFLDSLEISEAVVGPSLKLFDLGHCKPYNLVKIMLSEWIAIKKDFATIAELRRILREDGFLQLSDKLEGLQLQNPVPIKIPEREISRRNLIITSTVVSFFAYLAFYGQFWTKPLEVIPQPRNDPFGAIPQPHSSRNPPLMQNTKRPIAFGLKSMVPNFAGREEELARLNEYFHSKESPTVLISGLGGIGKTELAKKFTLDISDPSRNAQIVKCWLSGENAQSLLNSTSQFCNQLGLPSKGADGQPLPIQEMIQNIMAKLKSSADFERMVVVIDNVDDIHQQFQAFVETLSEFGSEAFLLVTSRRRDIYEGEVELLQVTGMQLKDSMEFIRKSLKITDNSSEDAIKSLCKILDNFPLALNQAAAFIRQQQSSTLKGRAYKIENYVDELTKNQKLGLDKGRKLGYSTATLAVWNITIDKINKNYGTEGQIALDLLDAMAFVNPDDISIHFLHKLYQRFYSIEEITLSQINRSLTFLLKYSLISSYNKVLNIHRLVQLSLRDKMSCKSPAEDEELLKDEDMLTKFWTSFDPDEWNQMEMRNVLTIWNHAAQHEKLDNRRTFKMLRIYNQLFALGMVNESYDFAVESSKFILEVYGDQEEYWKMEHCVALSLIEKGKYEHALYLLTGVYWKFFELYGVDYVWTLGTRHLVARCLYYMERFEYSLKLGQKVLQSEIRIHGENNEEVRSAKNLVAMTLHKLGKKEEAVAIFNELLEWDEENLGTEHENTLAARHNIAICFFEDGRFAEALLIFQNILPLKEQVIGVEHPDTLTTKEWLADTLAEMGEIDQALKVYQEVLIAKEKVLGAEHPQTIQSRRRVALRS